MNGAKPKKPTRMSLKCAVSETEEHRDEETTLADDLSHGGQRLDNRSRNRRPINGDAGEGQWCLRGKQCHDIDAVTDSEQRVDAVKTQQFHNS